MTEEQIDLLIKYIDAKIAEHAARESSDDGMYESIVADRIECDLRRILRQKESA